MWKIIGRSRARRNIVVTESINTEKDNNRRFTATINKFQNWKLIETIGPVPSILNKAYEMAIIIRDRIDAGDETVFYEPNIFKKM